MSFGARNHPNLNDTPRKRENYGVWTKLLFPNYYIRYPEGIPRIRVVTIRHFNMQLRRKRQIIFLANNGHDKLTMMMITRW